MPPSRLAGADLHPEVQQLVIALKRAFAARHPEIRSVQLTIEEVAVHDVPPSVDVRYLPDAEVGSR